MSPSTTSSSYKAKAPKAHSKYMSPSTTSSSKAKAPKPHPKYQEMVAHAILSLKERRGSSRQAIIKYIVARFGVGDEKSAGVHLRSALKRGVAKGVLTQTKGSGASGSFKVAKKELGTKEKDPMKSARKTPTKKTTKTKTPATKNVTSKKTKSTKASKPKKSAGKKLSSSKPVRKPKARKVEAKIASKAPAKKISQK